MSKLTQLHLYTIDRPPGLMYLFHDLNHRDCTHTNLHADEPNFNVEHIQYQNI